MRIVGREAELELVRRFLADVGQGLCALHLHGEPGIGKSTVWHAALSEAAHLGYQVVSTRPTEAEAQLPFAGVNDLFGGLLDDAQPDLPAPQRLALEIALLRAEPTGDRPEPLAISLAILGLLRAAIATRPLIIAVDDAPWLDGSSTSILDFVLRRLDNEPIGLLVARRTSGDATHPAPLVSAVPRERVREAAVAPLSLRETDRLLAAALGLDLAPSMLARVHRASGGNPFYSIEIARALQRRGQSMEGEVRLPDTLAALVRDRLEALSEAAGEVVAHASALAHPTVEVIEAALGRDVAASGVADAIAADVVTVEGNLVRFGHPLLAGEAYARLGEAERRELHRRLARVAQEPEEQVRHLALAADGPDEKVAQELARTADLAHDRGALDAAADLAARAVVLTPPGEEARLQRRISAARYQMLSGDMGGAREELEAALTDAPPGDGRAEVLLRLGEVRQLMDDWQAAEELFAEALEQAHDVRLQIELKLLLGGVSYITGRNWEAGAQHVAGAMQLAEELADPAVLAGAIGHHAIWQYTIGHGCPADFERRVEALEPWTGHLRAVDHPLQDLSEIRRWEGDWDGHREAREHLLHRAERSGDYSSIPILMAELTEHDFVAGRSEVVDARLDHAERLARVTGQGTALATVLMWRAILRARLGPVAEAREAGEAAGRLQAELGTLAFEARFREELALLELSCRDPAAAHEILCGSVPWASDARETLIAMESPLLAEVLIGLGRLDEARAVLDRYERSPPAAGWPLSSAYPRAGASRARALLCAAEGDLATATRLVATAQAAYVALGDRWEQARTQLIAGEVHRRARRRARARDALADAVAIFVDLGAALWAAQAREQLERIVPARDEAGGLTPTQRHVAELAIDGLTNRQVADRLFMSVHTVEAHLSAVYRTLGIRGRGELARALRDTTAEVGDSAPVSEPET
jgi:DNA-binding CsgD family transcriptional regulator